jgi:hypothetical protein
MLGTILIVFLVLALLVRCHDGDTVETGHMRQPEEWVWFS